MFIKIANGSIIRVENPDVIAQYLKHGAVEYTPMPKSKRKNTDEISKIDN